MRLTDRELEQLMREFEKILEVAKKQGNKVEEIEEAYKVVKKLYEKYREEVEKG